MAGKIMGTLIGLLMLLYVVCLIIFFFLQENIRENINMLNYEIVEIAATSGTLRSTSYKILEQNTAKYGDYKISMKLERQIKPGIYDTFYNNDEIINKPLKIGDRLTICLEDRNASLFERLLNVTFLGKSLDKATSTGIKSLRATVISKNATE